MTIHRMPMFPAKGSIVNWDGNAWIEAQREFASTSIKLLAHGRFRGLVWTVASTH